MRQRTAEILGLLLLMSYAIIGADLVPFHGDEATLLHVGQDPTGQDPTGSADSEDAAGAGRSKADPDTSRSISIEALGVDEIACLGDVATIGIAPGEVIDTLQALGCRCIMGNHDDSVASESRAAPVTITSRIHRRSVERSETSSRSSRTSEAFGLGLD